MGPIADTYRSRIEAGRISPDPAQADAVARLDALAAALGTGASPLLQALGLGGRRPSPRGLYIWGAVGRGKSMLMDLVFEAAPVRDKRRVHFHAFMLETHAFIHNWRGKTAAERRQSPAFVREAGDDPIAPAAKAVSDRARLLCFDELQVTQIADAMILGRLFDQLLDRGLTIIATSNRAPDDLYRDGINRQLFLPFIDRLKRDLDVLELRAERDYRLERLAAAPVYYFPLGPQADAAMDAAFERLLAGAAPLPDRIEVQGRMLEVRAQAASCARFTFEELCARPLGAADYLAIAQRFHTVLIDRAPQLGPERRNEAARFVTLIDALYENGTKLVLSAAAEPDKLYPAGDGAFEFERTASRLFEMRSADYLAAPRKEPAALPTG